MRRMFGKADLGARHGGARGVREEPEAAGRGGVRMLFQHDPAEPIGVWLDLREDGRGLFVRGRLMPGVARAREVPA